MAAAFPELEDLWELFLNPGKFVKDHKTTFSPKSSLTTMKSSRSKKEKRSPEIESLEEPTEEPKEDIEEDLCQTVRLEKKLSPEEKDVVCFLRGGSSWAVQPLNSRFKGWGTTQDFVAEFKKVIGEKLDELYRIREQDGKSGRTLLKEIDKLLESLLEELLYLRVFMERSISALLQHKDLNASSQEDGYFVLMLEHYGPYKRKSWDDLWDFFTRMNQDIPQRLSDLLRGFYVRPVFGDFYFYDADDIDELETEVVSKRALTLDSIKNAFQDIPETRQYEIYLHMKGLIKIHEIFRILRYLVRLNERGFSEVREIATVVITPPAYGVVGALKKKIKEEEEEEEQKMVRKLLAEKRKKSKEKKEEQEGGIESPVVVEKKTEGKEEPKKEEVEKEPIIESLEAAPEKKEEEEKVAEQRGREEVKKPSKIPRERTPAPKKIPGWLAKKESTRRKKKPPSAPKSKEQKPETEEKKWESEELETLFSNVKKIFKWIVPTGSPSFGIEFLGEIPKYKDQWQKTGSSTKEEGEWANLKEIWKNMNLKISDATVVTSAENPTFQGVSNLREALNEDLDSLGSSWELLRNYHPFEEWKVGIKKDLQIAYSALNNAVKGEEISIIEDEVQAIADLLVDYFEKIGEELGIPIPITEDGILAAIGRTTSSPNVENLQYYVANSSKEKIANLFILRSRTATHILNTIPTMLENSESLSVAITNLDSNLLGVMLKSGELFEALLTIAEADVQRKLARTIRSRKKLWEKWHKIYLLFSVFVSYLKMFKLFLSMADLPVVLLEEVKPVV